MKVASFVVRVTRSADWWVLEVISGLPADVVGVSQVRRLTEVDRVARGLISELVQIDPASIELRLDVELSGPLHDFAELFHDADIIESTARREASLARSRAVAGLLGEDLTMREAGAILGLSHQRIKQLVDRAPDSTRVDVLKRLEEELDAGRRQRSERAKVS